MEFVALQDISFISYDTLPQRFPGHIAHPLQLFLHFAYAWHQACHFISIAVKSLDFPAKIHKPAAFRINRHAGGRSLPDGAAWRSAIDLRREFTLGADWRGVLSNRLESTHNPHGAHRGTNALREAYVTRAVDARWFIDIGRVNVRSGVGLGYSPTDWLRGSVLATPTNQNPASARENRLGAFMLRMQHVTDSGSMHFAYAPQLTSDAAAPMRPWGLNLARGNAGHGFQWRWAPHVSETLSLDVMALAHSGQARVGTWCVFDLNRCQFSGAACCAVI